jgi:hypothetical protein
MKRYSIRFEFPLSSIIYFVKKPCTFHSSISQVCLPCLSAGTFWIFLTLRIYVFSMASVFSSGRWQLVHHHQCDVVVAAAGWFPGRFCSSTPSVCGRLSTGWSGIKKFLSCEGWSASALAFHNSIIHGWWWYTTPHHTEVVEVERNYYLWR